MPARTLPTIAQADVAAHNSADSCYVTVGSKVYDITPFLEDHPGGADLILEHASKDVAEVMEDVGSHAHSEVAWEILDEHLIGFVATNKVIDAMAKTEHPFDLLPMEPSEKGLKEPRQMDSDAEREISARNLAAATRPTHGSEEAVYQSTGMSSAADLSKETDPSLDFKRHQFLDLSRPLLMQVWWGGFSKDFYLEQVHRPRHYKGGESAPLFGNFLEPLSKTPWWVVPTVWMPLVLYGTALAFGHLNTVAATAYWLTGLGLWTLVEYGLHRFLFHLDYYLPDNRVALTLHFLLHGIHHYLPMDRLRLVMPPTLFLALATPFWKLAHTIFFYDWYVATAVFCGGIFGYICYDLTHYFLHHKT